MPDETLFCCPDTLPPVAVAAQIRDPTAAHQANTARIRAERQASDIKEKMLDTARPWDRDKDGNRPWDRKLAPDYSERPNVN